MRRPVAMLITLVLVFWQVIVFAAPLTPPQVEAEAAVIMVAKTRQVLFGQNQDAIMYPASTTKIMTLITAIEQGKLDSVATVSGRAAVCDGSSLELRAGDKLTLRELATGMMLVSGNDAAEAIAEHVGGSIPNFVEMMNANAERIGTVNTHFSNPHGLPDPYNHYTTASDLALITAHALQNPEFARIVAMPRYTVHFLNRPDFQVASTNRLLSTFSGANGVKTGFTNAAGDCLVASATRGGVQLIAVILNDDNRWTDAKKMLEYGFQVMGVHP